MPKVRNFSTTDILDAGVRKAQSREKRSVRPVLSGKSLSRFVLRQRFCNRQFERLKRLAQHGGILLSVVPEPSFPQSVSSNAVVGDVGFGIRDDVLDVLSRTQFDAASKELLCGNRCNACFLVVAGLACDPFT